MRMVLKSLDWIKSKMTNSKSKMDSMGLVFLMSTVILFSIMFVQNNIDIAISQTTSLATTFEVNESTYITNSSLMGNQIIENGSTFKDYSLTNTSAISNPLSNNPTYSVTNATIAVKTDILKGEVDDREPILVNQTTVLPKEGVIIGQN